MQTLRIFISSPGDVAEERQITGKVIERLQGKYWSFVRLDDVFWEQKVVRATAHYQDELINPGDCEIVLGILWSRLGSPLPEKFRKQTGERYQSGTEWELEMAFDAYEKNLALTGDPIAANPDIIIYRRRAARPVHEDEVTDARAAEQARNLDAYLKENYWFPDGTIKRPITGYKSLDEFEKKLSLDLEQLILRHIPGLKPGFEPPPISGSPFKGLHAFDFIDNDRYFGRNREIREIQHQLLTSARKRLPFLLIYGGSGYGKSSLMRAGLAPVLTRPGGSLDEIHGWRRIPFQPAKGNGPLIERLARAILQPSTPEEADQSRSHQHWPLIGLAELSGASTDGINWDAAALNRHFSDDDRRVFAIAAIVQTLESLDRHLLLEIDQLEELFTTPEFDATQRAAFLNTIADLTASGRVWTVATMRSEFFPRVAEQPELFNLVGKNRGYILPPPDRQSLREIIRYPALAARLDFERRIEDIEIAGEKAKHDYLHDQILADAESSPDALPLLEFTLQQLYDESTDSLLTWESYAIAGGLKGAIAKRATDVYQSLDPVAREARHPIFAALIHIDPTKGTITRQRAPLISLKNHLGSADFLNAFLKAHLLVTDEDSLIQEPVVTLAHEALISHWDELSSWIKDHRGDILARQRLAEQTQLWVEGEKKRTFLLSEARLAEAERVEKSHLFYLNEAETVYLQLSKDRGRLKQRLLKGTAALFAIIASAAGFFAWKSNLETARAEANQATAESRLKDAARTEWNIGKQSIHKGNLRDGLAYLARSSSHDPDFDLAVESAALVLNDWNYLRHPRVRFQLPFTPSQPPVWNDEISVLVLRGENNRLAAIDMGSGRIMWHTELGKGHLAMIFSPDGRLLITADIENKIMVRNVKDGSLVSEKKLLSNRTCGPPLAIAADGGVLALHMDDNRIVLFDLRENKEISYLTGHNHPTSMMSFSKDGSRLLSVPYGRHDSGIVWDVHNGTIVKKLANHEYPPHIASFDSKGNHALTASVDGKVYVWRSDFSEISRIDIGDKVAVAEFDKSGQKIFIASVAGRSIIFDISSEEELELVDAGDILSADFSSDDGHLLTLDRNGQIKIWPSQTRSFISIARSRPDFESFGFLVGGKEFFTVSADNFVDVWGDNYRNPFKKILSNEDVLALSGQFSHDGTHVITTYADNFARVREINTTSKVKEISSPSGNITCAALAQNGKFAAVCTDDGTLGLVVPGSDKWIISIKAHDSTINNVTFSPSGSMIATSSNDRTCRVWRTDGSPVKTLEGHSEPVLFASFDSTETKVLTGSADTTGRIWNLTPSGDNITLNGHKHWVVAGKFADDDHSVITASTDSSVCLWKSATGETKKRYEGFQMATDQVDISDDGKRILTDLNDSTAGYWDVESGKLIGQLRGHPSSVKDVAISPSGNHLLLICTEGPSTLYEVFRPMKPVPDWWSSFLEETAGMAINSFGEPNELPPSPRSVRFQSDEGSHFHQMERFGKRWVNPGQ